MKDVRNMPYKNREKRLESQRKSAKKHRIHHMLVRDKRRNEILRIVEQYKYEHGCEMCNERDPRCLEFHHKRDKVSEIMKMVHDGCALSTIQLEMSKCVILCANCHKKLHRKIHICLQQSDNIAPLV